jgi:hypothetical protein
MTRHPLAVTVFSAGAVLSVAWAIYNLRPLSALFGSNDFGGGAIFGYSTGIDVLLYLIAPLVAFVISRRVRERTGLARILRRAHLTVTGLIVGMIALFIVLTVAGNFAHGIDGLAFALLAFTFVGSALWLPLQSFFAAGFIGLLIDERRRAA